MGIMGRDQATLVWGERSSSRVLGKGQGTGGKVERAVSVSNPRNAEEEEKNRESGEEMHNKARCG